MTLEATAPEAEAPKEPAWGLGGGAQADRRTHADADGRADAGGGERADAGGNSAIHAMLLGVLDMTNVAVFMYDHDWRLVFVNDIGLPMFEKQFDSPVGMTILQLNPSWESGPFYSSIMRAATDRQVLRTRAISPLSGRWFETTTFPTSAGIAIYAADVDEEERAKHDLANTLKRLQRKVNLLNASKEAVFVQELDGTISYWSRGAEELYGWTSAEVLGRASKEFIIANPDDYDSALGQVLATGSWSGDLTQLTKDGRAFTAERRVQVALDEKGRPLHLLCTVSQEAEHDRTMERRFRAQRLESIGLLAGGIADNLNNVLAPLLLSSQYVAANESNPALKEILDSMEPTIKRGAEMISQVLTYSRGGEGQRAKVDARLLIGELEAFCRSTISGSIRVHTEVHLDHPFFEGDSTQIMQVLANLVTNARDAMPDGGTISIRAFNHQLAPSEVGEEPRRGVAVEVSDTGPGMTEDTIARVFEPFFSTKPIGQGTGLGLSTSLSIAQGHGGDLSVLSSPGGGTRMQLLIPATEELAAPLPVPDVKEPAGRPVKTVLVVDDEAPLRAIVQATLESHGYKTLGASHGREAVNLIENPDHRFDLIFTDLAMPEMDGRELEKYLHDNHPKIPVIAASGFGASAEAVDYFGGRPRRFLGKPFTTADLLAAVDGELPEKEAPEE